jgi:nucleoid-associated protein YgaU
MVLALLVEVLVGYLLVALALHALSLIPGSPGGLAGRVALLVSPGVVRRALDLLVGGAFLAQTTLAALPGLPPGRATDTMHTAVASLPASVRPAGPVGSETRPPSRRLAAPLPPWLGGGPSNRRVGYAVEPGDTLWGIAAAHLVPAQRSSANVQRYWRQIYRASRPAVGGDPDLILPGTHLDVPPFPGDQR